MLVSKCRFKVFKNPKTQRVAIEGFQEVESRYKIGIREFAFGEDYSHVHMEVSVPTTLSMEQVIQILKSHTASKIFREIPNLRKRYPRGSFWGGQPTGTSVGPVGEKIIQNYIRKQDVAYEPFLRRTQDEGDSHQRKLFN